jgi:hypothetical protein
MAADHEHVRSIHTIREKPIGSGCKEQGDRGSAASGPKKTHVDDLAEAAESSSGASYSL